MMHDFDAVALFELARKLISERSDEAIRRTAANRFYYAAFLVARRKAQLDAIKEASHTVVRNHWLKKDSVLQRRLSALYTHRQHADYVRDKEFSAINLADSERLSQSILRKLGAIP